MFFQLLLLHFPVWSSQIWPKSLYDPAKHSKTKEKKNELTLPCDGTRATSTLRTVMRFLGKLTKTAGEEELHRLLGR